MYYDEIAHLYSYSGGVPDELDSQQVFENTLIVFMSDNGRPIRQSQCAVAPREAEEFYDLSADPHKLHYLAADRALTTELARHRAALDAWRRETGDFQNVRAADEFERESGDPLPNRMRPRSSKASLR